MVCSAIEYQYYGSIKVDNTNREKENTSSNILYLDTECSEDMDEGSDCNEYW